MSVVVSDTSPIRALAHLGRLNLLAALFGEVLVPPSVADELRVARRLLPALDITAVPAVRVQAPVDRVRVAALGQDLGPGESEAIVLALELRADHILIDEWAGRQVAEALGLRPLGVLGLLVKAKHAGLVTRVGPLVAKLEAEIHFFVSADVRADILRDAGE